MEKAVETGTSSAVAGNVERRLAQLKVLARVMAHEIELAAGEKTVSLEDDLARSILTTLELFIEDVEGTPRRTVIARRELEKKAPIPPRMN